MALKDKIAQAQAQETPSRVAEPTPTPVSTPDKPKTANTKTAAFKQDGAAARAQMSEDQKAVEGSKSDKVAFVCALGDPNRKQPRKENNQSLPSYVVVGYKFKVLEDMTVPFAPIAANWKTPLDVEPSQQRPVKAGEIVALNIVETAMFISRIEFAGKFTGEGTAVTLSAKSSQDRQDPLPILNKVGAGSVKEGMELIADMVGATADTKGTPVIKEEYKPSFGALYNKQSLTRKSATAKKNAGEGYADIAAAFRQFYAGK